MKVKATGLSHFDFSSLSSPLKRRSLVGNFLGGELQKHCQLLHVPRMILNQDSNEDEDGSRGGGGRAMWCSGKVVVERLAVIAAIRVKGDVAFLQYINGVLVYE